MDEQSFAQLLSALAQKCDAFGVLVITKDGKLIEAVGALEKVNTVALAALIAGMFAATKEVARLVGEKHFSILLQQGEQRHIHITLIGADVMLIILFEDYHKIGIIRNYSRQYTKAIQDHIYALTRPTENVEHNEFKEYAMSLIDQIFS